MKTQMRRITFSSVAAVCLCATLCAQAQQRQSTGFGGAGGFGGSGFGSRSSGSSGSSSMSGNQYNPNGGVGSAIISMDPDTRNITVIADEATMKNIGQVIQTLDKPKPQVLIKVVFLELQHDKSLDLGPEGSFAHVLSSSASGSATNSSSPVGMLANTFATQAASTAVPGNGIYQVLSKDFQVTLHAIAKAGKSTLLSRPSVVARDGQPASIVVGQQAPLPTSVSYTSTGSAVVPIIGVTYTAVGIILKVTPFITEQGLVQMMVSPQTSQIDPTQTQPLGNGVSAPYINTRSADTVVVTPDSQTVVIGGLMQHDKSDSDSGIPFLSDIPWLGKLFKRNVRADQKTELLIFLTPYIVQTPTQLTALGTKERGMIVQPKSESEEALDRFLDKVPVKKQKGDKK